MLGALPTGAPHLCSPVAGGGTQEEPLCSMPRGSLVAPPLLPWLFSVLGTGPDLKKLSALSAILKDSPVSISRTLLSSYSLERFQEECQRILEQLQESSSFAVARNVAELAALPVDNVVIQEVPWSRAFLIFIPVDCVSSAAKLISSLSAVGGCFPLPHIWCRCVSGSASALPALSGTPVGPRQPGLHKPRSRVH